MDIEVKPSIDDSWKNIMCDEFKKSYFIDLKKFLLEEKSQYTVYPPGNLMFSAFNNTPFDKVKVVIIGQDPYHGFGQAHGLSFSVPEGIKPPPSLVNIFKELQSDLNIPIQKSGCLQKWATQGVLLLNATLSVRANQAGSHQKKGWEQFTDAAIAKISELKEGVIFILWGNFAKEKQKLIDEHKHYILSAAHPSPFSAYNGFLGCKHFSKTNELLIKQGKKPIEWDISK